MGNKASHWSQENQTRATDAHQEEEVLGFLELGPELLSERLQLLFHLDR
jgi:hypothetical protein